MKNSQYKWSKILFFLSLAFFVVYALVMLFPLGNYADEHKSITSGNVVLEYLYLLIPAFTIIVAFSVYGLVIDLLRKYNSPRWLKYGLVVYLFLVADFCFLFSLDKVVGPLKIHDELVPAYLVTVIPVWAVLSAIVGFIVSKLKRQK